MRLVQREAEKEFTVRKC